MLNCFLLYLCTKTRRNKFRCFDKIQKVDDGGGEDQFVTDREQRSNNKQPGVQIAAVTVWPPRFVAFKVSTSQKW